MLMHDQYDFIYLFPHPDDEIDIVGLVGALTNKRVKFVCATDGANGQGDPETRKREAFAAAEVLGAEYQFLSGFKDGHLLERQLELTSNYMELIQVYKPNVVGGIWGNGHDPKSHRLHMDHRVSSDTLRKLDYHGFEPLASNAIRESRFSKYGENAHNPEHIIWGMKPYGWKPTHVVPINKKQVEVVQSYINCFGTQRPKVLEEKIMQEMRRDGKAIGVEYGVGIFVDHPGLRKTANGFLYEREIDGRPVYKYGEVRVLDPHELFEKKGDKVLGYKRNPMIVVARNIGIEARKYSEML